MWGHSEETAIYEAGNKPSPDTKSAKALILDFTAFRTLRNEFLLSFIEPLFAWNVPSVSLIFLKRSLVFPIPLFSSIYLHWSLRKAFLSLLAILRDSAFKWIYLSFSPLLFTFLLFTAIRKHPPPPPRQPFCFFVFLFHGDGLDPCLLYNVTNLSP